MSTLATVIVAQRGQTELTQNLVNGIWQFDAAALPSMDPPVIVVDDNPCQFIATAEIHPAEVHRNPFVGLTAAWNHGIRQARRARTLIVLNNDVVVSGPFIRQMCELAGENTIVGVKARQHRSIPEARRIPIPGLALDFEWLEGWCMAIPEQVWTELGGFDESMRLYFSDLDFQIRAVMAGFSLRVWADAPLAHLGHRTTRTMETRGEQWLADRAEFSHKYPLPTLAMG